MNPLDGYAEALRLIEAEGRLRKIPPHRERSGWLDLSSNDYMGLAVLEPELREAFTAEFADASFSSAASRLLGMDQNLHLRLESLLEELYGRPALLFNSGYHANCGVTAALNLPGTLFVCDKLIHASMIDGLHAGRCEFLRFPHNDMTKLRRILERESPRRQRIIVMVESVYSMDGDKAPLPTLAEFKKEFPSVMLYVDEAHAFGVRGKKGLGLCEEYGVTDDMDLIIGTLGKAAFSTGAFCIASREMTDCLVNTARSFIFSTALPPVNVAWSIVTVSRLTGMNRQREYLRRLSSDFRRSLSGLGFEIPHDDTPIVPLLTGSAEKAVTLSSILRDNGILALPIRRPTVPPGGERIRFSLNASLLHSDLGKVIETLEAYR